MQPPPLAFNAQNAYESLSSLPSIVADKVKSMREWILGMIESALTWIIEKGKALLAAVGIGKKDKKGDSSIGEAVSIDAPGESHTLYFEVRGDNAVLMVASDHPMTVPDKLNSFQGRINEIPEGEPRQNAVKNIASARSLAASTDKKADDIARAKSHDDGAGGPAPVDGSAVVPDEQALAEILKQLYTAFGELGVAPLAGTYGELRAGKSTAGQEAHHVPPKGVLAWMVKVASRANADLSKSPLAANLDLQWVKQLAATKESMYSPGNPLAAIAVDKHTHIKTTGDPVVDAWRIHWGSETAKAVFAKLASRQITIKGQPGPLSFVFIRRRLWHELSDADRAEMVEMEAQAGAPLGGPEVGVVPGAAGLVISTQFFHTELFAALEEAQGDTRTDLENLQATLGEVARGAVAMSRAAVESSLANSKRDGTEDEKSEALAKLNELSANTWNALPGVDKLNIV